MPYSLSHIASILNGQISRPIENILIEELLFDSRRLVFPKTTLFFALPGSRRNGVDFISDLFQKGVRSFVTDNRIRKHPVYQHADTCFIIVEDVLTSLQKLVSYHRSQFDIPVIGITGSNGKTIVKEWLAQALTATHRIVRSPASFNSQLGVPMSVWSMNAIHTLGIFEAGISQAGEMEKLEPIIRPSHGILTFMGEAHAEGFKSFSEKVREKLILFNNVTSIVYCCDQDDVHTEVRRFSAAQVKPMILYAWGTSAQASFQILNKEQVRPGQTTIKLLVTSNEQIHTYSIPFSDEPSVFNAITCVVTLLTMGWNQPHIQQSIDHWRSIPMRLEQRQAIHQCTLINDSYSADISSLRLALEFLAQQTGDGNQTVVLTDLEETGMDPSQWVQKVAELVSGHAISRFIGIGPWLSAHQALFTDISNVHFFEDTESLIRHIHTIPFQKETILLKGSRSFTLERVGRWLESKAHDTVMEINLNALRENLAIYRKMLPSTVKLMVMVKAFGYGTGGHEVANVLKLEGVDYLAVAFADEGVALRQAGIELPIMVLNPQEQSFDSIINYRLEPELYSFAIATSFAAYVAAQHIPEYRAHLKLDTGMHRLGFMEDETSALCTWLTANRHIHVASIFSHLAASEDAACDVYTQQQKTLFLNMANKLEKALGYQVLKHLSNTAAIHRHSDCQLDMVRLGIGLYGVDAALPLKTVATLKTTIAQIKHLKKDQTVGYGRAGKLIRDSTVATVRIGYADGYPRCLSNGKGHMQVNGHLAPVLGNVCMDMTMLDITGLEAREGEEVLVFGEQLPIELVAQEANTIPYEILTGISQRVKRVYIQA